MILPPVFLALQHRIPHATAFRLPCRNALHYFPQPAPIPSFQYFTVKKYPDIKPVSQEIKGLLINLLFHLRIYTYMLFLIILVK